MSNKVALITGAGSGIGRATALLFAKQGISVSLAGRREKELQAVREEIIDVGGQAQVVETDISNVKEVKFLIEQTIKTFKRLDIAFNNAGVEGKFTPITQLEEEDFDYIMNINFKGAWLCIKYEIEAMLRLGHGGVIVNTSSWLAHGAFAGSSIYSASKAALDSTIRAIALEIANKNIRINNVNPGIIDTPMLYRVLSDPALITPFVKHTPMQRLGKPEDIASVVDWLCSDKSSFLTGQNILVDGGYAIAGHRP